MKIEIHAPQNPCNDYKIYIVGKQFPERNYRHNIMGLAEFDEDDIENLLTPSQYKAFREDGKYQFEVSKKHLQLITGERSPQTRQELTMYPNI